MPGEIIFEFHAVGQAVKVSAVDADSGLEVSIVGPRTASQRELEATAAAKLRRMMEKQGARRGR